MITLRVAGIDYTNFTSASVAIRLDALCNTFTFDAAAPEGKSLPFLGGEACEVAVDGEKVLTGYIEVIDASYSASDHTISISGRDKTGDLLDSSIDVISDISGVTLKQLIERVIKQIGLDIKVIDNINPDAFSKAEDLASPEAGDNAFQFIEKYARKRQVMLTSDADGNIVIDSNSGISATGAVQHLLGATDNNVVECRFSYDTTGRFNSYKMASSLNPVTLGASSNDLGALVAQSGGVLDPAIRKTRQLILVSEVPYSSKQCIERARWESDVRKARGLRYTCTVNGFRVGGEGTELWQINRLYQITDDFVGKQEQMLCNSVAFDYSLDGGSATALEFIGQDAYKTFEEPIKKKSTTKLRKVSFFASA